LIWSTLRQTRRCGRIGRQAPAHYGEFTRRLNAVHPLFTAARA